MHRIVLIVLLIGLSFLKTTYIFGKAPNATNEQNRIFIVLKDQPVLTFQKELSGSNTIHSNEFQAKSAEAQIYADGITAKQQTFELSLKQLDSSAVVERRMAHVINAMVVSIDSAFHEQILSMPEVKYTAPITRVEPFLTRSHSLMNVEPAWQQLGTRQNSGEGVLIAIIDTGIDVSLPVFDDTGYELPDGFPKGEVEATNKKVIVARTFAPRGTNRSDDIPDDKAGHGTNVASIAASNVVTSPLGVMSGVAPKAYLGNYKIFFDSGAGSDQVVGAINQAVQDGAHVLNMSFGSELYADPHHDPQIEAIQNAIDMGVICVLAAGNEGRPMMIGNPQQVEDAITVAASQNSHASSGDPNSLTVSAFESDGSSIFADITANFGFGVQLLKEPHLGSFRIHDVDLLDGGGVGGATGGLLCEDLPEDVIIDGWVLVQRGNCFFTDKVNRADAAGANGVIFYNHLDGELETNPTVPSVENTLIPSMIISRSHGLQLKEALANGQEVTVAIRAHERETDPTKMTTFSNAGPSVDYIFKPEITAIGLGSFGATQNDYNNAGERRENSGPGFTWIDGTSMAAPRISGLAALIKQKHPDWNANWIKSAIVLSASPVLESAFNDTRAELNSQGGGLADAGAALNIETVVIPPIVGFGAQPLFENNVVTRWIQVINTSERANMYSLSHMQSQSKPVITPSVSQFLLGSNESIDIELKMQFSPTVTLQDHETTLLLENLMTGDIQPIKTWVRVSFEQPPVGDILLVDDDEGRTFDAFYEQLLAGLSREFTKWNVNLRGESYPNLSYMRKFKTILWFMGEKSLNALGDESTRAYAEAFNARHLFETAMAQYLTEGGTLFLSGQDFMDDKETAMISREVLHTFIRDTPFTTPTIDRDATANTIQGVANNPVFSGAGPFNLTYPDNFEDLSDRLFPEDDTSQPAFYSNGSLRRFVGMTIDACSYKAVFLAFPLEALEESAAEEVLSRSLDWFDEGVSPLQPKLISVSPQRIEKQDASTPISIEINGEGFALVNGYRAYIGNTSLMDEERQSCNLITATLPAEMEEGSHTLRVVTGAGHQLVLPNAVQIIEEPPVAIHDWELFQ